MTTTGSAQGTRCVLCDTPTTETVRGTDGVNTGVMCADCQEWCDGNIIQRCIGTRVNDEGRHVRCWEDSRPGGKLCATCEPTRCPQHPGFEPDNCPGCGTAGQILTSY